MAYLIKNMQFKLKGGGNIPTTKVYMNREIDNISDET